MVANTDPLVDAVFIDPTLDLGIWTNVAVGNYVWFDDNHDGIQNEAPERGVNGVTATLFADDGITPVTFDVDGSPIAPIATANDATGRPGYYRFENLLPGTYVVKFSTIPAGFSPTTPDLGGDDALDSDGLTATSRSLGAKEQDLTLDLGLFAPVSIGNYVWEDLNANGLQDEPASAGMNGVVATLYAADGTTPITTDAFGTPIAPQPTANDGAGNPGYYNFGNLLPGQYVVKFTNLPAGFIPTAVEAGTDPALDSNGLTATSAVLPANASDITLDSGFYRPASLGDFVWLDSNQNGQQDAGEPGVGGVTVELLDANGAVVASTVTGSAGEYAFTNLRPGTYTVHVIEPTDKAFTAPTTGATSTDSNVDRKTGISKPIVLISGTNDPTIDAGLVEVGAVAGVVFVDKNKNGVQDPDETPIANVKVKLVDANGNVVAEVLSDSNGKFLFPKVPIGSYTVVQEQPRNYRSTTPDSISVTVQANQTAATLFGETASLPLTGTDIAVLVSFASLLLASGAALMLVARRRRTVAV
jgi:LPXTG-motif cell wall-anchored protein